MGDIPGALAASFAEMSFIVKGRTRWTAALVYRAIELEPWDATARGTLSGFLDDGGLDVFPSGFKMLSAIVLERALADDSPITEADRRKLDHARFVSMWAWGFAHHQSGEKELSPSAFRHRPSFSIEGERYRSWWAQVIVAAGSPDEAFRVAVDATGVLAGFLKKRAKDVPEICGAYRRDHLVVDEACYAEWLMRPVEDFLPIVDAFDALKKKD